MKFASLVLSGFLLVVLAGCGSDSNSGRVSQLSEDLAQAQEDRDTALAAQMAAEGQRDTAQTALQTTRTDLTTTQTELDETEDERDTAQQQRDAAQADADTQRELLQDQVQEEADAESIQRAYGLLEAMDVGFRGPLSTDATNIDRSDAATKLAMTHPLGISPESPRISNNAPTIRESASGSLQLTVWSDAGKRVPEFTAGSGIPSLTMGGSSLSSRLFERIDEADNAEELAVYTDFSARNVRLLDDLYTDYRRWVDAGTNETVSDTISLTGDTETNEIRLASPLGNPSVGDNVLQTPGSVDVNEKMRTDIRTLNEDMYGGIQKQVPALQPRLSGVSFEANSYTLQDNVDNSDYTIVYELANDQDTEYTDDDEYSVVKRFPAALRGVTGWVQFRGAPFDPQVDQGGPDMDPMTSDGDVCTASPTPAECVTMANSLSPTFMVVTRPRGTSTNPVTYEPTSYSISGTGDWTFLPSSAGARVWVDDGHYMYFGWWQETPDQADGVYDFHVFADGVGRWGAGFFNRENTAITVYDLATQSDVVYTGPAVGKYVRTIGAHDELDHAGERRREAVAGIFTADGRLEADFMKVGTSMVEGTITNFVDDGTGDAIPGRWQVILGDVGDGSKTKPPNVVPATNIAFGNMGSDISDTTAIAVIKQIGQGGGQGALPDEDQTGRQEWQVIFLADELSGPLTLAEQDSVPAAAVGRFDVGLRGVIHFSGAFGVSKN